MNSKAFQKGHIRTPYTASANMKAWSRPVGTAKKSIAKVSVGRATPLRRFQIGVFHGRWVNSKEEMPTGTLTQKSLNFTNRTNSIFPFGQFDLSTERTIPSGDVQISNLRMEPVSSSYT